MESEIYIDDAKYAVIDPYIKAFVYTVKFTQDCESYWLTLLEVDGMPSFYINRIDLFDKFKVCDENDYKFNEYLKNRYLTRYEDIEIWQDYDCLKDELEEKNSLNVKLFKYICYLANNYYHLVDKFIEETKGKSLSEIEIPESRYQLENKTND